MTSIAGLRHAARTALTAVIVIGLATGAGPAEASSAVVANDTVVDTIRVAGTGRLETAVEISRLAFPDGAPRVYLARADVFADALTAGPLAAAAATYLERHDDGAQLPPAGPVLLVPGCGDAPAAVRAELQRVGPDEVIALGGTAAICDQLVDDLAGTIPTRRIEGTTRFGTATAIAEEAFPEGIPELPGDVFLARAEDSPDAVAAASLTGGPILLVPTTGPIPAETRRHIDFFAHGTVYALGGTAAVSDQVLADAADGLPTQRLAGGNRIETAIAISTHQFPHGAARVHLARADVFADAIAAGSLTGGPVLLVPSCGAVPPAVADEVARLGPNQVIALGGTSAVCDDVVDELAAVAAGAPRPALTLEGLHADGRPAALRFPLGLAPPAVTSADGRWTTLVTAGGLWLRDTRTGETRAVDRTVDGTPSSWLGTAVPGGVDPRRVLFNSGDSTLVSATADDGLLAFVRDTATGTTALAVPTLDGAPPNDTTSGQDVSADGRFVLAESSATNLVDDGNTQDIGVFVIDRADGGVTRVSVDSDGGQGAAGSQNYQPIISGDGNLVYFTSSSLRAAPTPTSHQLLVHDRRTGGLALAGANAAGESADHVADALSTSDDGQVLAFSSYASNLVDGDSLGFPDKNGYVRDMVTGEVELMTATPDGTRHTGDVHRAGLSADGRWVVFAAAIPSLARSVAPGISAASAELSHIYLRDRVTGTVTMLDVTADGTPADGPSGEPAITADGTTVHFTSQARNLWSAPLPVDWEDGDWALFRIDLRAR